LQGVDQPLFQSASLPSRGVKVKHSALPGVHAGAQIAEIKAAARAENAINLANTLAKVDTMGLKASKDVVG
jgi:hypothetical protein